MAAFANPRRLHVGLDVSVDQHELNFWQEDVDKDMLARTEPHVVKLYGRDDADQPAGEFTGTLHATQPLIWTAAHALHYGKNANSSGATSFVARYQDGTEERVTVEVWPVPGVDLMLLKGTKACTKRLEAACAARCDVAYVLGCRAGSAQVSIDHGAVSATEPGAWYVTAHAGAGWSGGPVVNRHGRLIGLVQDGKHIKYVRIVPAETLHTFAVMHGKPAMAV